MHNPFISNRRRQIMLFLSYVVMTAFVLVVSAICILLILGYRFDFSNRSFEQGGLIQFRSVPSGATVVLNDKKLSFTTPGKQNVLAGEHSVEMSREGYLPWRKNITLEAGELRWLNYARLIPEQLRSEKVLAVDDYGSALPSPNRQYILVAPKKFEGNLQVLDIRNPARTPIAEIDISEELELSADSSLVEIVQWSSDSRYALIKVTDESSPVFYRIDRTDPNGSPINISRIAGFALEEVSFDSDETAIVIAHASNALLRRINLSRETVSSPLSSDVYDYHITGTGDIAVASVVDDQTEVSVIIDDTKTVVANVDSTKGVSVSLGSYYEEYFLAVASGKTLELIKSPETMNDTAGRKYSEISTDYSIKDVEISNSGRFVVAQSDTQFTVFDLETEEVHSLSVKGAPAKNSKDTLRWLDGYYFYATGNKAVNLFEFDGNYGHTIASSVAFSPVTLSRDGEFIYYFTGSNDNIELSRSQLIID